MRLKNIEIMLKMPLPSDGIDDNGVKYTKEAIEKACAKSRVLPIILDDGTEIGITNDIVYNEFDNCMYISGTLKNVGTSEEVSVVLVDGKANIVQMDIINVGIGRDE